jgi:DNA topoisomerase-6 subunit B
MSIADELAKKQRSISVAEFFEKNRHLLGFDSKTKAVLSCVKEAVDNGLDACEDMATEIKKMITTQEKKGKSVEKFGEMLKEALPEISVMVMKAADTWTIVENPGKDDERVVGEIFLRDGRIVDSVGVKMVKKTRENIANTERKAMQYEFQEGELSIFIKREPWKELPFYSIFLSSVKSGEKTITKKYSLRSNVSRYRIVVEDNGPGIVKEQIPRIFGSLLYGSKFHTLKQARGQQGIGISAAVLYGQLTTGKPARIISKTSKDSKAVIMSITIDTVNNKPEVIDEGNIDVKNPHGTRVDIEMEGIYTKSVAIFLKRTSIVNPHAKITLMDPDGKRYLFKRTSNDFPKDPIEIKPHPHGIEMGILQRMLKTTSSKTLLSFLNNDFSRVGSSSGKSIISKAKLDPKMNPAEVNREQAGRLISAMHAASLLRPPTDCLSPIGEKALKNSLLEELKAEFVVTSSREPSVYRGIPFQVEIGLAYGGKIGSSDSAAKILRFANKMPLLWDMSGCALTNAIKSMDWRRYGLSQPGGQGLPTGPMAVMIHFFSAWVPYTSEGKTAIANYPIIVKEVRLALQDASRKLKNYLTKKYSAEKKKKRVSLFIKYAGLVSDALSELTEKPQKEVEKSIRKLLKEKYGDVYEGVEEET